MVDESNPVISRFTNKIKELINNKADKTNATQSDAGLMSAEDKIKLDAIDTQYSINVEKQSTADTGFFSTYVVKQNNTQKGVKINIPKDFLVKSATVKACTTANNPIQGYSVGDKYIDFVINTKDSTGTDEHLYLAAKEIGAYPVDEITLTVANGKLAIKNNGITWAKLATAVQNTINGKEVTSNKVTSVSASSTNTQYPSAKCVYDTFCQGNDPRLSDARTPEFVHIGATSSNIKDLNDYTTGGFYFCSHDTHEAPYINNCPKTGTNNKAFFLLVEPWATTYLKQTLTYYNDGQKTYIRTKMGTSWSPWHLVKTTEETVSSTHTTSTSAWTGKSENLVSLEAGTVIYYWLKQAPKTDNVTLDLTLANGDATGEKNVYFGNSVRLTNQFKAWTIIGLYWDGYNWFVINPYNDNHNHDSIYIKNANGTVLNANIGNNQVNNAKLSDNAVSTSKIQNKAVTNDKIDPMVFWGNGTGATAGYIKMIKFVISEAWKDKPITFDLYNRQKIGNIHVSLKFKNDSGIDPEVDYFSYTSYNGVNLYIYKEETSTWSIIIQKESNGNFEIANLIIPKYENNITYTQMNTQISELPSDTSTNPLIQATQRTYGGTAGHNITAPAFIKNGGTSAQFLKANGSVETLNTTPFTVTYTNGTTSTINFVTR